MMMAAISGAATTTAVTGMVIGGVTITATTAAVIGAVVSGIVGSALISKPSIGNFNAQASSILINKQSNTAPIPVIYGTRRVGGTVVFMDTLNQKLFLNILISEGEIDSYLAFYFNNELASSKHAPFFIDRFFGTETQQASSKLTKAFDYYNDTHRLAGTAYLAFSIDFNHEAFPAGRPVINTLVKGVKIFDPRTSTIEWADNPALCVRDYLTNSRYGRGIDPSLIDDTSFILAANYCDEEVSYNGVDLIKRYTCNGVVETQNSSLDIIKQLLSSCRGLLIFSGGLYKIIIDKPEMAVFTFSEDNIIGGWKINLGSKNKQFNRMRANFFNSSKEYQTDIAIVDYPLLRETDGSLLEIMNDLPFTSDIVRAKAITTLNLNQSRHPITCEFTSTIEALRVEVGDVVYINHATPGWDTHNSGLGKKFRIIRVTLQNNEEVRILANEYADEVYDLDVIETIEHSELVVIDDMSVCLPPTNLSIRTINVERSATYCYPSWTKSVDPFVVEYEVSYKKYLPITLDGWIQVKIPIADTWSFFIPRGHSHEFRVRAINSIGVASAWLE